MSDPDHASPLNAVILDDEVNRLLEEIRRSVETRSPLVVRSEHVQRVRKRFAESIETGEQNLHAFARTMIAAFAKDAHLVESRLMVFGRCKSAGHGGLLRSETPFDWREGSFLLASDSALAAEHAPLCSVCGEKSQSIASFIQYKPKGDAAFSFIRTRIKSTSHIAYKVADIVFDIDRTYRRDKIVGSEPGSITDVYGMKLVVPADDAIEGARAKVLGIEGAKMLEDKDYTGENRKRSGFEARKLVIRIHEWVVEVQIQSKRMFDIERQGYNANHQTYKEKQMEDRKRLGKEYAVLYQALLEMFSMSERDAPKTVEFALSGKGLDDEF